MKVKVYYNLHKHTFSIQTKTPKGWRVTGYADKLNLRDVEFRVSEAGRQRVLKEGRKNVHAFVIGTLVDEELETSVDVSYNPYKQGYFYRKDNGEAVSKAAEVTLVNRQVKISSQKTWQTYKSVLRYIHGQWNWLWSYMEYELSQR